MGRPKVHDDRTSTSIRLSPALYEALREAATERDVSMNWLIVKAIEDFLPRLLPASEIRWTRPVELRLPGKIAGALAQVHVAGCVRDGDHLGPCIVDGYVDTTIPSDTDQRPAALASWEIFSPTWRARSMGPDGHTSTCGLGPSHPGGCRP